MVCLSRVSTPRGDTVLQSNKNKRILPALFQTVGYCTHILPGLHRRHVSEGHLRISGNGTQWIKNLINLLRFMFMWSRTEGSKCYSSNLCWLQIGHFTRIMQRMSAYLIFFFRVNFSPFMILFAWYLNLFFVVSFNTALKLNILSCFVFLLHGKQKKNF